MGYTGGGRMIPAAIFPQRESEGFNPMTGIKHRGADRKVYPTAATAVQVQETEKVKNKSTRDYGKP